MNYERLYEYRFRDVAQAARSAVWSEIAPFIHDTMERPCRMLDPAAGRCEFINAVPAAERWAVDRSDHLERFAERDVRFITSDVLAADLPDGYFDGIFVSNFLEHLACHEQTADFLGRMLVTMAPGGRIAVMGPNFKHCAREYFDCADHTLIYTHVSVAEQLYAAGFTIEKVVSRFLPYSFRGRLPASPQIVRLYLKARPLWQVIGRQFLVLGRRPGLGGAGASE
jgi:Methyltransferase domain